MNTVLNKTSYQEFKKPLILGSGLCFLPSVIFLGCCFVFFLFLDLLLTLLGEYVQQFQSSDKEEFVPQGKIQLLCYGGKNAEQFLQHFDTSSFFPLRFIVVDVDK